jgi:hypothetical protein
MKSPQTFDEYWTEHGIKALGQPTIFNLAFREVAEKAWNAAQASRDNVTTAEAIVHRILADVTDRRGWSQEWDQFDPEIKDEIQETWKAKILKVLNS